MAAHSYHVVVRVVFQNFYAKSKKILYINTSISKRFMDVLPLCQFAPGPFAPWFYPNKQDHHHHLLQ